MEYSMKFPQEKLKMELLFDLAQFFLFINLNQGLWIKSFHAPFLPALTEVRMLFPDLPCQDK